jgi:hypothetical protein
MMTIKQIEAFPPGIRPFLMEYAQKEYDLAMAYPNLLWGRNLRTWLFMIDEKPIFMGGITKTSLAGSQVELWLLYCRDVGKFAKHTLRFLKRALRRVAKVYPRVRLSVEHSFETGKSFARALGFVELPPDRYFPNNTFATFEYRG